MALSLKEKRKRNKEYMNKWYKENPEEQLNRVLWTVHRIRLKDYLELVKIQESKCALCGKIPTKRLYVDHDHNCCPGKRSCGKCIRGLLCKKCNSGIGYLGDTLDGVLKAVNYLKKDI